jgi:hypothetical protein
VGEDCAAIKENNSLPQLLAELKYNKERTTLFPNMYDSGDLAAGALPSSPGSPPRLLNNSPAKSQPIGSRGQPWGPGERPPAAGKRLGGG